jgi:DNA-binding MarR family transcriptional regulator
MAADFRPLLFGQLRAQVHFELVQVLGKDKSNISHNLRTLEARGFITIGRTAGGKADYLALTPAGRPWASEIS